MDAIALWNLHEKRLDAHDDDIDELRRVDGTQATAISVIRRDVRWHAAIGAFAGGGIVALANGLILAALTGHLHP